MLRHQTDMAVAEGGAMHFPDREAAVRLVLPDEIEAASPLNRPHQTIRHSTEARERERQRSEVGWLWQFDLIPRLSRAD